ncbi:hypothetical protein ZOSMA_27G00910 [Zostera marina]|uniref:Non-haem dioxygenase N-terminal domain-containing protein n=1 Tax=Zostera marina TaxID=29655 RepID=A0A0K9PFM6_ZOSMR|nr:hypothetical protein ZOSMA_27G00910 [Zostera marina]
MQGIFIATDHGVPKDVIRRCEEQCKRLFFLQPDQKLSVARKPEEDGVLSNGYENFIVSDHFSKSFWSETFKVSSSPLEHVLKNYGQRTTKHFGFIMASLGCENSKDEDFLGFEHSSAFTSLNSYPTPKDDRNSSTHRLYYSHYTSPNH